MTILVIEDDQNVLTLLERLLIARGHTVLVSADPDHAGLVIEDHGTAPDLLVIDLILGGRRGLDYAKSLKAKYLELKIVFVTGWPHRAPEALRSGLGPVLHKPFTAEQLYTVIDSVR